MANNDLISRQALLEAYDRAHEGSPGMARRLIEDTEAYSPWADDKHEDPVEGMMYLLIVSGKPKKNITMHHAYTLGTWIAGEGWILDMYPEWENPTIHAWAELPDPPVPEWECNDCPAEDIGDEVCETCAITYSWERGEANVLGETNDADE